MENVIAVSVDRINNPKSINYKKWVVCVARSLTQPVEAVYINESKKACVEYAKRYNVKPHISNGVAYGARF